MRHHFWCLAVAILSFLFISGCGGLRTEYVEGIVTLDGEPVEGALVTFHPVEGEARYAAGDTNTAGKYVLTTAEGGKPGRGAIQGEYKITVSKRKPVDEEEPAAAPATSEPPSIQEMAAREMARRQAGLPPPFAYLTPKVYNNLETSGFTATVVRGKNRFNFEMVSE